MGIFGQVTVTLSMAIALRLRGVSDRARMMCLAEFMLMAFITRVEPSSMVRIKICETKPKDQAKASQRAWSLFVISSISRRKLRSQVF